MLDTAWIFFRDMLEAIHANFLITGVRNTGDISYHKKTTKNTHRIRGSEVLCGDNFRKTNSGNGQQNSPIVEHIKTQCNYKLRWLIIRLYGYVNDTHMRMSTHTHAHTCVIRSPDIHLIQNVTASSVTQSCLETSESHYPPIPTSRFLPGT